MSGLGAMMAGGNPAKGREDRDFYPTPAECTVALLRALDEIGLGKMIGVWEPACGDGAIVRVLERAGLDVTATDIADYGIGAPVLDFLSADRALAPHVITNPPFSLAEAFIRRAHELRSSTLCLLLKSTFWHAARRQALWDLWQPAHLFPLTWRPDFRGWGAPTMEAQWVVWLDPAYPVRETIYRPLRRPELPHAQDLLEGVA